MLDQNLLDSLLLAPALPTVFPLDPDTLCNYADALSEEGYPALEVLARPLPEALAAMQEVNRRPQRHRVKWGVGTMRTAKDAQEVIALRPDFLVSPAFSPRVLDVAVAASIPYIPAVHTFQDVQNVLDAFEDRGLEVRLLKLCPVYGLTRDYVQSLCGCFPGISFCPTGEVTLENYLHWKSMPGIVAPMGSRLAPTALLQAGDWSAVRERLRLLRRMAEEAGRRRA
jgi:2-dehydro-3-deoxyphosphogluconate aldolase / (4S)-4-hydroxy-2-oxoglutarate aldolase